MKKLIKFTLLSVSIFLISSQNIIAEKISILYTIENKPITNIEINNEINYLILINPKLNDLNKESLVIYATKSIIREKIKEIEVAKYFKFGQNQKVVNQNIQKFMSNFKIKDENEFHKFLNNYNLPRKFINKKIEIELLWNQLIYEKYKNKITIDIEKIKENIKKKINKESNKLEEFLLYEILFSPTTKKTLDNEINKIYKSLNEIGFENTASIFSISGTSKDGGKVGWVNENQLSKTIINNIKNLDNGQFSKPINVSTGTLKN